jgi:ribosome-binding protein aMBF1 (putative translation factor)
MLDEDNLTCQYVDMVTTTITNPEPKTWYAEDMDIRPYSADNLAQARKEKGLSRQQLADACDVSFSMITKLEQNARGMGKNPISPTADVLAKLGKALDVYFVIVWGEMDENSKIIFRNKRDS